MERVVARLPEAWVEKLRSNETIQRLAAAARDRAKMVNLINDVSKTVRIPVAIPTIAPVDDLLGGFSKELTRQSKDLFVVLVVAGFFMLVALVMGQLKHVLQLFSLSLALKNSIVAVESGSAVAQKNMLMYLLLLSMLNAVERTPLVALCHAVPFYGVLKMGFLLLCSMPDLGFAMKVYKAAGRPLLFAVDSLLERVGGGGGARGAGSSSRRAKQEKSASSSSSSPSSSSSSSSSPPAPPSPPSVAGYFAVIVHEATMDSLDPELKYYCTLDAVNEGEGEGAVNFPFSTGPSQGPHLSWRSETLGMRFPSRWTSTGVAVLTVAVMKVESSGAEQRVGACEYVLQRGFANKTLDLVIKDAGQQEIGRLSVEARNK